MKKELKTNENRFNPYEIIYILNLNIKEKYSENPIYIPYLINFNKSNQNTKTYILL